MKKIVHLLATALYQFEKKRISKLLGISIIFMCMLILFQNCSKSFQIDQSEMLNSMETNPSLPGNDDSSESNTRTPDGGNQNSGNQIGVNTADIEMVFPPPNGSTVDNHMIVRGRTKDGVEVTQLKVNGILATSADQYKTWSVDVPLAMGSNFLSVEAKVSGQIKRNLAVSSIARAASEADLHRGAGAEWDMRPLGLAYEPIKDRYIVAGDYEDGIVGVNAVKGDRVVISDSEGSQIIGNGYEIVQPRSGAAYGEKSFVIDNNLLVLIDNITGNRSIFSTMITDASEPASLASIVMTADSKSLIALSNMTDSVLYKIDASTAAVSILSLKSKGLGDELRNAGTMGYSSQTQTAFVSIRYSDTILAIDTVTGNRRIFSLSNSGEPRFQDPEFVLADDKNGLVYVWDSGKLHALDIKTGRRRTIVTVGSFSSYNDIYGMAVTPYGPAILDYIPNYVTDRPQRGKTLMVLDPLTGTRVVISR